jgi:transcription-repair coupling factor (superfamily II helicase)
MNLLSYFHSNENELLVDRIQKQHKIIVSGLGNVSSKCFVYSDLINISKTSLLVVVPDNKILEEYQLFLPIWCQQYCIPFSHLEAPQHLDVYNIQFIDTLYKHTGIAIVPESLLDVSFPSIDELNKQSLHITKDEEFRNVDFFNTLIRMGYSLSQDIIIQPGEYRRSGSVVDVFPINAEEPYKIEIDFDQIKNIWSYNQEEKKVINELSDVVIYPLEYTHTRKKLLDVIPKDITVIFDEIEDVKTSFLEKLKNPHVVVTAFPEDETDFFHLRYLSMLKFYSLADLLNDLHEKNREDWKTIIFTKRVDEIKNIFSEEGVAYTTKLNNEPGIKILDYKEYDVKELPPSFQNPSSKVQFVTDKEIFSLKKATRNKSVKRMNLEFLSSLREGDYVVHFDHGIGLFEGIVQREISKITREYLEITYAENDKLFVPVDQADKVSKYLSREDIEDSNIKLSRLGSKEWKNITRKVKKDTEKIAKELLKLYAERERAKGFVCKPDGEELKRFEAAFPYEETPGQLKAIKDIKRDMEGPNPMDRLLCGDVGFGKTEVAMRAAFKMIENGRQVAFISPVTILADQHYRTFCKRAKDFDIKVEMLSRFRSAKEQRKILDDLKKGKIDVIIGTHRLLQSDVEFLNLGIVIVDEEQRFGVKQKEALKHLRASVDILTLTATPIPRTLNLSLNKLRDITIITTPPPGRLPIITEVRKYGTQLIREVIMKEIARKGQVYFLHNRVETIDGMADKLRSLIPEARFVVAHGQLGSGDLEERIVDFKEHKYDVLVSSTIIENGIDLANANTLIVNNAENLGLSQLYQLRGRIGRGKQQAYAYFLYHKQRLKDDAKKRLRAVVEASELGAGFQLAMRDLEIRGAGEILGVGQHGTMNTVGASHFIRLLNQTIEDMKSGKVKENLEAHEEVTIELPVEAYIPDEYMHDKKDKLSTYQRLSSVDSHTLLAELKNDIVEEYGPLPAQVTMLFRILDLKMDARKAGVIGIKSEMGLNGGRQIVLTLTDKVQAESIIQVLAKNDKWLISGLKLKIDTKDLGFEWMEALRESIIILGKPIPEKKGKKS